MGWFHRKQANPFIFNQFHLNNESTERQENT